MRQEARLRKDGHAFAAISQPARHFQRDRLYRRHWPGNHRQEGEKHQGKTVLIAPGHGEYDKFYGGAGICLGYADQKTIEVYHTLKCAAEKTPCEIDFRFGMKVMQVIDAVLESAEKRCWVTVK